MSDEKWLAENLLVLGNAVPDIISDSRITVCTVGYSTERGLVRIYPVPPGSHMKRWNIVRVPLERNPKDTRAESWKIQGSKNEWDGIGKKIELQRVMKSPEYQQATLKEVHDKFGANCVEELNERKVSLGMIRPQILTQQMVKRDDYEPAVQSSLTHETPFRTIKNYPLKPVLTYRCPVCQTKQPHQQQIVEWGVFEWMRKNPTQAEKVWENMRLLDPAYDKSLLVGNMAVHRTSFMVVSVFRFKLPGQKAGVLNKVADKMPVARGTLPLVAEKRDVVGAA